MNRVVITDMQVVSPIGTGKKEFYTSLDNGVTGLGTLSNIATDSFPNTLAAEAKQKGVVIGSRNRDRKELFMRMLLNEMQTSGSWERYLPDQRHLWAGMGIDYFKLESFCESENPTINNWHGHSVNTQQVLKQLSSEFEIIGSQMTNVSACVASSQSIGAAFRNLRNGMEGVCITGGADSMLNHLHYMGFYKLGALTGQSGDPQKAVKPFDLNRSGLVLGEGAALFTIEQESVANKNKVLAEIAGYGCTMDSYMITDPLPDGSMLAKAARHALEDAGLNIDDIDCVHCHGTGTPKNDVAEAQALKILFGSRSSEIPVFSLKSQVGHCIAACGAVELCAALYSIENQCVPPTVNFETADPEIPLNVLKEHASMPIKNVLKLNAAFGGQNTALIVRKYE